MDVFTVGKKNYVKASVIARELGYTTDYVGQLCRANKVDAKLFGRSWYVEKDSIHEHKSSRYRTTGVKSVKALREHNTDEQTQVVPVGNKQEQHFYIHNSLKPSPRYVADDSELLPEIGQAQKMQGNLRINLADSSVVKIASSSEEYVFNTPKMPEIKFKGSLTVTETSDISAPEGGILVHPKEVSSLNSEKRAQNKVSSFRRERKLIQKTTQIIPVETDPEIITKVVFTDSTNGDKKKDFPVSVVFSTIVSFSCVVLLLGLEARISVVELSQVTEYVFNFKINHLLASVYSAL